MKRTLYIFIAAGSVLLTGCMPFKSSHKPGQSSLASSGSPNIGTSPTQKSGAEIYNGLCLNCHGPLASSAKKGATAVMITNALNSVTVMQPYKSQLSPADIIAVSEALQVAPPPPVTGTLTATSYQVPLGSRFYMASAFRDIFNSSNDAGITAKIDDLFIQRPDEMGGLASRFDPDRDGVKNADRYYVAKVVEHRPNAPVYGQNAVTRQGFVLRACQEVLQIDIAVTNALRKAGLTASSAGDDANLTALYQIFVLGGTPSTQILTDLKALHARALQISSTEAWRFSLLAICRDPAFQAL